MVDPIVSLAPVRSLRRLDLAPDPENPAETARAFVRGSLTSAAMLQATKF